MPGINGIYVGNELKRQNENIIIFVVTSYAEYLDDAMRFHVFRYLSKPLDRRRLFRNMNDAIDLYHTMTIKISIETKQGVHTFSGSDIIAIEALGRKVVVHTTVRDLSPSAICSIILTYCRKTAFPDTPQFYCQF